MYTYGNHEDFENFIHGEGGVAPNGLVIKQNAKPKPKEKNLGEILISMQKQQQRTILLNPPLFSVVTFPFKIATKLSSIFLNSTLPFEMPPITLSAIYLHCEVSLKLSLNIVSAELFSNIIVEKKIKIVCLKILIIPIHKF